MRVMSKAKFIRMSPKKVRLVLSPLKGKNALAALSELDLVNKRSAAPVKKVLKSAIADAEHNFNLKKDGLIILSAKVDEGPRLKRFQPRARGMAYPILKRTSHISIVLDGDKFLSKTMPKKEEIKTIPAAVSSEQEVKEDTTKPIEQPKTETEQVAQKPDFKQKIFRRKSI